ncbi:MAG: bifunctional rhamnulose-1-phosphate aldolase/short-chain dehydrogenase [Fibrobacteres bacterium]|nr:bifunctional rhamnulose-1-phosphate aldolase/short-chain dehydrogenase [Fibrobacterota bacterium]
MNTAVKSATASAGRSTVIPHRWDDKAAQGFTEEQLLLYRSNLLGSDLRVTNYGGGNTSAKVAMKDPLTAKETEVLWVKGSGGDIGSMKLDGFSTLYMDKLNALKALYRGLAHEDEMVGYLPHCTFNLNTRAASIDTPLHAYVPQKHVDHVHPDSVIAIAASKNGEALTQKIFEGELGWIPWQRPGYDLGLKLEAMCKAKPNLKGIMLGGHGFFTWGKTSKECYQNTLRVIQKAQDYIDAKSTAAPYGGPKVAALAPAARAAFASRIMPALRGKLSKLSRKVGHFNDSPEVLDFVCSKQGKALAALGTSCPDHFLRTKIFPLFIDVDPAQAPVDILIADLDNRLEGYRKEYEAYYDRCKRPASPAMRDPYPVIILVPGVGMFSFASDKATARIAGEFYVNAINVIRGAGAIDEYVALPEQEAFDIEYWALEEAKLRRMPKPKSLAARIALITGGAGGIGMASAKRLLDEGAVVCLTDIDAEGLQQAQTDLAAKYGRDAVRVAVCNVTDEGSVIESLAVCAREFGGVDILVNNAGIASAAAYEETSLELWNKNLSILATGYFLVSREAYKVMLGQGMEASLIFISSKNGLAASQGASAYCTAKAAEIHLARCLALEGAPKGIRVNVVNPDAIIRGSKLWHSSWRKERAAANKINEDQIEEHYRQRSMLKRNVFPEDVAEAVYFFASDASAKSTGNILNVDAGNVQSFPR